MAYPSRGGPFFLTHRVGWLRSGIFLLILTLGFVASVASEPVALAVESGQDININRENININKDINFNDNKTQIDAPQATLIADNLEFHLILNRTRLEDLGAWLAFFDFGLSTGLSDNLAGLQHIDYKIENQQLFRYAPMYGNTWKKECDIRVEELGQHLILHIPRPHITLDDTAISWRVALFPHQQETPLLLPLDQCGKFSLNQASPFRWPSKPGYSLDLSLMLLPPMPEQAWQSAGWTTSPFAMPEAAELALGTNLQSPWDEALWWPQASANQLNGVLTQDLIFALRLPEYSCDIVFSRPPELNSVEVQYLNRARSWACHRQQGHAIFIVKVATDIPPEADAVLMQWPKATEVETLIKELAKIRETYAGPLYGWMDELLERSEDEKHLCIEAWLKFGLRPLLPAGQTLRTMEHLSIADVLWFRLLIEKKTIHYIKIPASVQLALYEKLLKQSPENYLMHIESDLREWFEHQNL